MAQPFVQCTGFQLNAWQNACAAAVALRAQYPLLARQSITIPAVGGSTVQVVLGVVSTQVLAADQSRKTIIFHNPDAGVDIMVSQAQDVNGNALDATFYAVGPPAVAGVGLIIPSAGVRVIDGDAAQGAWVAAARSGTTNGLTIITSKK